MSLVGTAKPGSAGSSCGTLGCGVLFLSLYSRGRSAAGGTAGVSLLFGSILGLRPAQAVTAAAAGVVISALLLLIARPLLFLSVDPDVAAARGVPATALSFGFLVLLGATVAEAVQAVGALLILGLLVMPAATAQRLTARPYLGLALSGVLAVLFVWAGLVLAFYLPYPASFLITTLAFATYLVSRWGWLW